MIVVGLTGKIATGKTTILNLFNKKGFKIFNSDDYVKRISSKKKIVDKIRAKFPEVIKDGIVDKNKLREVVLKVDKLRVLEDIYHPYVKIKIRFFIFISRILLRRIIILEVPLLFESGINKFCDYIIFSDVSKDIQEERFLNRGGKKDYLEKILLKQSKMEDNKRYADFIIDTNKEIDEISKEIDIIIKKLL